MIKDAEASRRHLRIKQRGRLFILEDLDSRNGTYVNGDHYQYNHQKWDKILLGSTELVFAPESSIQIQTEFLNFDMEIDHKSALMVPSNWPQ